MFKFSELKSIHLEITNRCQASCPMCSRNIHGGVDNPNLILNDWTTDDFKNIISRAVLAQVESLYFCGNFGDPIINHNLADMCEYVSTVNQNINLRIHTNGGARSTSWWESLPSKLPKNHRVIFGIDGLEDTHHLYRKGTTYSNVIKNATAFINNGGCAEWVFIKFKHNEHQVDEAKKRAKELGFVGFNVKNSSRFVGSSQFDVRDNAGNVLYYIEPPTDNQVQFINKDTIKKIKSWTNNAVVSCKALDSNEVYIDAAKIVYPCCFIASSPLYYTDPDSIINGIRQTISGQYSNLIADLGGIDQLNALNLSISDIIESTNWQTVWYDYWNRKRLTTCARICGSSSEKLFTKPQEQIVEKINLNEN
jgi:MoaA/NifB/PqqE/SkfB family radical SAM enzyme